MIQRNYILGAVAAIVLGGAGTVYAAKDAMPGDKLYKVKINVTEKLAGLGTWSEEKMADRSIDLLEKRMVEAEKTRDRFGLSEAQAKMLLANIDRFEEEARERIRKMKERGNMVAADAIAKRITAVRDAHQNILTKIENVSQGVPDEPQDEQQSPGLVPAKKPMLPAPAQKKMEEMKP